MNTIVLGTNHNNTLGLIWSLGVAGHKITLLLYKKGNNFVSKSKYVTKTYFINQRDSNLLELIKKIAIEMDEKPVVLVSNDGDATFLNNHFKELIKYCFFEGGRQDGSVNQYRNKDIGNQLALHCGFTLPQNLVVNSSQSIDYDSLKYPAFIKANNSTHGGKLAMKKCDTQQQAEQFIMSLPKDYFPLQVQEFINKEYEIMLLGCSLYGGQKVICPVANKKIRQYPKYIGLGSWSESVEVVSNMELKQLAYRVSLYMQEIGYTGNFSAEFLFSKGQYYFLEINLRNDGTSWLSTCSGFNLPDMVCRSFVEENVSEESCVFQKMNYMNTLADVNYFIDGTLSWKQWRSQFKKDTCYSHYNKNDKQPFKYYFKHPAIGITKVLIKRILNLFK